MNIKVISSNKTLSLKSVNQLQPKMKIKVGFSSLFESSAVGAKLNYSGYFYIIRENANPEAKKGQHLRFWYSSLLNGLCIRIPRGAMGFSVIVTFPVHFRPLVNSVG